MKNWYNYKQKVTTYFIFKYFKMRRSLNFDISIYPERKIKIDSNIDDFAADIYVNRYTNNFCFVLIFGCGQKDSVLRRGTLERPYQ